MPTSALISHLNSFISLSELESEQLTARSLQRIIKRRQFLLTSGEVCKHYYFVVEGCFKMYKVDATGKEHIVQFSIENEWISDIGSFHSEVPSQLYIEALEASIVIQIAKKDLIFFYEDNLKFNRIFRVLIEDSFVSLQSRLLQTISTSAEERYIDFMKRFPHLFNRISNVQIASYLGVTPEFLSAIRKRIANS